MADRAPAIDAAHLRAAIAVWERCEASARHVFGNAVGDRIADEILRALRSSGVDGITRTAISGLFKNNESTSRIGAALELLHEKGLASRRSQPSRHGPATEIWIIPEYEMNEMYEMKR